MTKATHNITIPFTVLLHIQNPDEELSKDNPAQDIVYIGYCHSGLIAIQGY